MYGMVHNNGPFYQVIGFSSRKNVNKYLATVSQIGDKYFTRLATGLMRGGISSENFVTDLLLSLCVK